MNLPLHPSWSGPRSTFFAPLLWDSLFFRQSVGEPGLFLTPQMVTPF